MDQRIRKNNAASGYTFYVGEHYEVTNEQVWVDDAVPGGATLTGDLDGWTWESASPASGEQ